MIDDVSLKQNVAEEIVYKVKCMEVSKTLMMSIKCLSNEDVAASAVDCNIITFKQTTGKVDNCMFLTFICLLLLSSAHSSSSLWMYHISI